MMSFGMRKRNGFGIAVLALFTLACSKATTPTLTIGLLPGESAPTVMRLNEPMRAYLERRLKVPVRLVVGANYAATGEALRFARIDVAYLGPVTYVLQKRNANIQPVARPSHATVGPTFQSVIIVPGDSPLQKIEDLEGKSIAFGDPASTSGTWVPRYQLLMAGLVPGRNYTKIVLGAHDAVALAVANHKADAGGLSLPIFKRLLQEGRLQSNGVRVLAESTPIPEYMWTVRADLDPALKSKLRDALLALSDKAALGVFRAEAFVSAADSDVDIVRNWVASVRTASPEEFAQ